MQRLLHCVGVANVLISHNLRHMCSAVNDHLLKTAVIKHALSNSMLSAALQGSQCHVVNGSGVLEVC